MPTMVKGPFFGAKRQNEGEQRDFESRKNSRIEQAIDLTEDDEECISNRVDDAVQAEQHAIYESILRQRESNEDTKPPARSSPLLAVDTDLPDTSTMSASRRVSPNPVHDEAAAMPCPSAGDSLSENEDVALPDEFGLEPYTFHEYTDMLSKIEDSTGKTIEDVEHGSLVKGSNNKTSKENTTTQDKAMYGRTCHTLAEYLFTEIFRLKYFHVFVDIGHGIGTLCLHASMTRGCESRGIELCDKRYFLSKDVYLHEMKRLHTHRTNRLFREVSLRHGMLEEPEQRSFITEGDKVFCNNFNDVFGCRSTHKVGFSPNDFISGLFCLMKHKAEMVTLCQLVLPPSKAVVNEERVRNKLNALEDASFFDVEIFNDEGGEDKLSFTEKPFEIYKYTRISEHAQWYCWTNGCENSTTPIKAWREINIASAEKPKQLRVLPILECDKCHARVPSKRERRKTAQPSAGKLGEE